HIPYTTLFRSRRRPLAHRDLDAAETVLFASEDDPERVLLAERLLRETRQLDRREALEDVPAAHGRRRNGKVHAGERLGERVDAADRLHDVGRSLRPPLGNVIEPLRARSGDPEVAEAEVLHRPRRGADVPRLVRLDEDDAEVQAGSAIRPR